MLQSAATKTAGLPPKGWLLSLLPNYQFMATFFWLVVVFAGLAALAWSVAHVVALGPLAIVHVVIGMGFAALAGVFPLRLPRSNVGFFAGETFIFALLLLYGAPAAALAAGAEALVLSLRTATRRPNHPLNAATSGLSMLLSGLLFEALVVQGVLPEQARTEYPYLAMTISAVTFAASTLTLHAIFVALRENSLSKSKRFAAAFGQVTLTCVGSAVGATLLFQLYRTTGEALFFAAAPMLLTLLSTIHYYVRHTAAEREAQRALQDAQARQHAVASTHAQDLARSEQRFHSAFSHASTGMALVTLDGIVLKSNPAFDALLGAQANQVSGITLPYRFDPQSRDELKRHLQLAHRSTNADHEIEAQCTKLDGTVIVASVRCTAFSSTTAKTPCVLVHAQDITSQKVAQDSLEHVALYDPLTGLANRKRMRQLLDEAVQTVLDEPRTSFTFLVLDCDRFKHINDSMSHAVGDRFLAEFSQRLVQTVRPNDVVARLGGDEFAVLTMSSDAPLATQDMAERILNMAREPFELNGVPLTTTVSIGVVSSGADHQSSETLMRDADVALHRAKALGKDRFALFEPKFRELTTKRFLIESELKRGLASDGLCVAYQPLYDIGQQTLIGFEALARWFHPTMGFVSPAEFIPVAEECGAITDITDFVLRSASTMLAQWQLVDPAFANLQMHVNISGQDLAKGDLDRRVQRTLKHANIKAEHLVLELTETILMSSIDGGFEMAERLRALGIELAIDDFGTGYSSLSNLARLPISCIKIDASFVRGLAPGSPEEGIVKSVLALAQSINKSVVAEGIETQAQRDQLIALGCKGGQGYLMAKPMLIEAMPGHLATYLAAQATRQEAATA